MGPPSFGGGNDTNRSRHPSLRPASMGPPSFGGGNGHHYGVGRRADDELQWGHRLSAVETFFGRLRAFPTLLLQWGHRLSAVETCTRLPFLCSAHSLASMGPPSFGGGNMPVSPLRSRCVTCFNGATVFRRWKQNSVPRLRGPPDVLQWGHRLSAVETLRCRTGTRMRLRGFNGATVFRRWKRCSKIPNLGMLGLASMGPPSFGGGNDGTRQQLGERLCALQWGHRLSAVETSSE